MVVFSCYNCGDSVKKPAVEKHYQFKCNSKTISLSCMDCFKNFDGSTYQEHTTCISEEQRYAGKGYVPKESSNSGMRKQESWIEVVKSILQNPTEYELPSNIESALRRLQGYTNIPRKKAKFINFVKNSLRLRENETKAVWDVLEKALTKYRELLEKEKQNRIAATKKHEKDDNTEPDDSESDITTSSVKKVKKEILKEDSDEENSDAESNNQNDIETPKNKTVKIKEEQNKHLKDNTNDLLSEKTVTMDSNSLDLADDNQNSSDNNEVINESMNTKKNKKRTKFVQLNSPDEPDKKKKKCGSDSSENDDKENTKSDDTTVKFNWKSIITEIVSQNPNGISISKLKKKVLKKYKKHYNISEISSQMQKTFYMKLAKSNNILIDDEIIKMDS